MSSNKAASYYNETRSSVRHYLAHCPKALKVFPGNPTTMVKIEVRWRGRQVAGLGAAHRDESDAYDQARGEDLATKRALDNLTNKIIAYEYDVLMRRFKSAVRHGEFPADDGYTLFMESLHATGQVCPPCIQSDNMRLAAAKSEQGHGVLVLSDRSRKS
jgi:hypothetical protein